MRYASAYQLWKKYSAESNKGVNYTTSEPKSADGKTTVDFTSDGEESVTVTTTWGEFFPLQTALVPLVVNVSKTPCLQYIGSYDAAEFYTGENREGNKYSFGEELCLKTALKLYKGTAWEPAIQKRLKEA